MSEQDVVAQIDQWRIPRTADNAHLYMPMDMLLQRARDEIVALRDERETLWAVAFDYVRIRAEALEEAAQLCFRANPQSNPNAMGHAIRALKDKRDE